MVKKKAAFFDRDGTLINNAHYLSHVKDIRFLPKGLACARWCQSQGYVLFVVTNQSGIARGLFDELFVENTHEHLNQLLLKEGIVIRKWYFCPHHPTEAVIKKYECDCECRKPKPGMLLTAAREYSLDLSQSIMIGDKQCDFQAGLAAGCRVFDIAKVHISGKL